MPTHHRLPAIDAPTPVHGPTAPRLLHRSATGRRLPAAAGLVVAVLLAAACGGSAEETTADTGLRNEDLNLSFALLPQAFEVTTNDAREIRLTALEEEGDGEETTVAREMWVEVDEPSDFGIVLPDVVNSQKELYEAMPGGSFSGSQRLGTPAGMAFYSRGQYDREGTRVEETRVFLVHPTENRLVTFHYRYPASDDSATRIQDDLFGWVGEMAAAREPASDGNGESEPAGEEGAD